MDYMPAKILTKQASTTIPGLDTASNFGGGLAVVACSRSSDKPDYSMTKGGVRLWLSVALFLLLLSAFTTLTSRAGRRDSDDEDGSDAEDVESHKISIINEDNHVQDSNQPESVDHSIESSLSEDQDQEEHHQEESASLVEDQLLAKLSLKAKERQETDLDHDDHDLDDQDQKSSILSKRKKSSEIDTCEIGDQNCDQESTNILIKVRKTKGKSSADQNFDHVTEKSIDRKIKVKRTKGRRDDHVTPNDQDQKIDNDQAYEESQDHVTDSDRKIRVKRTKGRSISEDHVTVDDQDQKIDNELDDQAHQELEDHVTDSDRKIKVKRTKGRSISADHVTVDDRDQKIDNDHVTDSDREIRVTRTKGRSIMIEDHVTDGRDRKIKVYKTKGFKEEEEQDQAKLRLKNQADQKISDQIDRADQFFEKGDLDRALKEYEKLIVKYPKSALAHYGRAKVLDQLSDKQKSNQLLEESFREYELVLNLADVTDDLYMLCAERLVDRLQFRGWLKKSIKIQEAMLSKFPQNVTLLKRYGLTFLISGQNERAEQIFKKVLKKDPQNGHTSALYGFVLKTSSENRLEESIDFLYKGVKSSDPQAQDARFYFHLGDALQRLDRSSEAYDIYEQGVRKGFFLSKYQRSLYNVGGLKSRPWWSYAETTYEKYLKMFENEWKTIRDEALSLLDEQKAQFKAEDERLTNRGDWRQFTLFVRGRKVPENCAHAPKTCSLAAKVAPAAGCTRGQIKFSLMRPGTKVWPHCGPTNCRIRAHLGLVVPPANRHPPRIRVANETRTWKTGRFIIFDDSFEHEVWYDEDNNDNAEPKFRLILIVDFWHPDLTAEQRSTLDPI